VNVDSIRQLDGSIEESADFGSGAHLRELGNTRDVVRALGDDPDQYASRLAKQYKDLSLMLRQPAPARARSLSPRLTATLDTLGNIFNWWQSVLAPNAIVGITQRPGTPDTGGVGIGADIFQGQLALGGEICNVATQEQWWEAGI
jgi:hypothetical protein